MSISTGVNTDIVIPKRPNLFVAIYSDWGIAGNKPLSFYDAKKKKIIATSYDDVTMISFDETTLIFTCYFHQGKNATVLYY